MRLGGPVFGKYQNPEQWIDLLKKHMYSASYCPIGLDATMDEIIDYSKAATQANIVIAEVGAWSNPLSNEENERKLAIKKCKMALALADNIGANCCVNISGSRGKKWDGPDEKNLTTETFDMIVQIVRDIIDEVNPSRTFYTLETMPWMYPDSAESYLKLIKAIDRKNFAVHFDPVNIICSPQAYFSNGKLIKDFVEKLGPYIRSCHAKDIWLADKLTTHLDEVRPGLGNLDYRVYLREINKISKDIPLMLEHLKTEDDYNLAAQYIRSIAKDEGIPV